MYNPFNLTQKQGSPNGVYAFSTAKGVATFDFTGIRDSIAQDRAISAIDNLVKAGPISALVLEGLAGKTILYTDDWTEFNIRHPDPDGSTTSPPGGVTVDNEIYLNSQANPVGPDNITAFGEFVSTTLHETLHAAGISHESLNQTKSGLDASAPYKDGIWPSVVRAIAREYPASIVDPRTGQQSGVAYPNREWKDTIEDDGDGNELRQSTSTRSDSSSSGRIDLDVYISGQHRNNPISIGSIQYTSGGDLIENVKSYSEKRQLLSEKSFKYNGQGNLLTSDQRLFSVSAQPGASTDCPDKIILTA